VFGARGRRVHTLCQHESRLRPQRALFHVSRLWRLHVSLRLSLPQLDAIPEMGATKR
jgi:hypothetical protein